MKRDAGGAEGRRKVTRDWREIGARSREIGARSRRRRGGDCGPAGAVADAPGAQLGVVAAEGLDEVATLRAAQLELEALTLRVPG